MSKDTKHKRKVCHRKRKKRLNAIRRVAEESGCPGLYFYREYFGKFRCSTFCDNGADSGLVNSPVNLNLLLNEFLNKDSTKYMRSTIKYEDDNMTFSNINELKEYLLIKQLAGIK